MILSAFNAAFSAEAKGERVRSELECAGMLLVLVLLRVHRKASDISVWPWAVTLKTQRRFVIYVK